MAAIGSPCGRSKVPHWANLSLVVAVLVNSMPKYKKLQNGPIELPTKTVDLDKLPKVTNTSLKLYILDMLLKFQIPNKDIYIHKKRLSHFCHLDWGIQPFQLYSRKIPSPIEWLLNPGIKEKYKKCLCLLFVTIFFCIILFGPSYSRSYINKSMWGQNRITSEWSQISNGNTACPDQRLPPYYIVDPNFLSNVK